MFQQVTLLGRTSEPKISASKAGNTVISFGLAVQPSKDSQTEWFNCSVVGKFADALSGKLSKGQLVFVQARASSNRGDDGKTYVTYFVDTLRICNDGGHSIGNASQPSGAVSDEDLPF